MFHAAVGSLESSFATIIKQMDMTDFASAGATSYSYVKRPSASRSTLMREVPGGVRGRLVGATRLSRNCASSTTFSAWRPFLVLLWFTNFPGI